MPYKIIPMNIELEVLMITFLVYTSSIAYNTLNITNIFVEFMFIVVPAYVSSVWPVSIMLFYLLNILIILFSDLRNINFSKPSDDRKFMSELTFIKSQIMILVVVAIFACDFTPFPSRFMKTRYYGISLMDVGIGSFLFHNGMFASKLARGRVIKTINFLFAFGLVRYCVLGYFEYHVDITEYGRDFNFYFILALVYLIFMLIDSQYNLYVAIFLGFIHQLMIYCGADVFIFKEVRSGFIQENKEGLFNIIPSLVIFMISNSLGKVVFSSGDYCKRTAKIGFIGVAMLLGYYFISFKIEASRRLGNISYILWTLGMHTVHVFFSCIVGMMNLKNNLLQNFAAKQMMPLFMWSNLLVLICNLLFDSKSFNLPMSIYMNLLYLGLVFILPPTFCRLVLKIGPERRKFFSK